MLKVMNICGARPNFMKIAPLMEAYRESGAVDPVLVHTGQHHDRNMSELFFHQLDIPEPDINLGVGSGSHAQQTAEIMMRFEPVLMEHKPDWLVVVGDVNSTIACALVASKLNVKLAHVEAGLRSFDRGMPEEINRVLTDSISDLLFVSEESGVRNLRREGIAESKIRFVGNVMIDTLLAHRERARESKIVEQLGLGERDYVLVTLHRPSNVDAPETLTGIVDALAEISRRQAVVFVVHPRTHERLESLGVTERSQHDAPNLHLIEPVGYLDFLKLMSDAAAVLTDSGGVQEETTILNTPCFTLRRNTERPVTIEQGTNRLIDPNRASILAAWESVENGMSPVPRIPDLWDGKAASRIVAVLLESVQEHPSAQALAESR